MGHYGGLWKVSRPGSDSLSGWSGMMGTAGSASGQLIARSGRSTASAQLPTEAH